MPAGSFDQNKFYVYVYLNPLEPGIFTCEDIAFKFKPIYVGKGCGNRIFHHLTEAKRPERTINPEKAALIRKILNSGNNPLIFKVKEGLTDNEALTLEQKLIDKFGLTREEGIPTNINKGGAVRKHRDNLVDFVRLIFEEEKERLCLSRIQKSRKSQIQIYWQEKQSCNS